MDKLPPVPDDMPGFVEWLRGVKHTPHWRKAALAKMRWQQKRLAAGKQAQPKHQLGVLGRVPQEQLAVLIGKLEVAVYEARKQYMRGYMQERRAEVRNC